jgi:enamine deaminase RidA (YjgF/YER057c/UK114 family)
LGFDQAELIEGHQRQLELRGHVAWMLGVTVGVHGVLSAAHELALDNLEAVLAAADMTLANVARLKVYTTDVDELFKHWANLPGRFANSDGRFVASVLGVTRLAAPQLLVLLEATAVD